MQGRRRPDGDADDESERELNRERGIIDGIGRLDSQEKREEVRARARVKWKKVYGRADWLRLDPP